uniref:Rhodanese domain-containing protein n=1 Tax=Chlamydomonas leiostraca TaxID=1034604 RepID=A0A7S0RIG6_9CHLO|mmetsp:Transcript_23332/g.59707  ORF Transcript_23332/g.59707 Transcript_23332/m.59707 type:complete len:237 (+) Transcript_23332:19-729(+)
MLAQTRISPVARSRAPAFSRARAVSVRAQREGKLPKWDFVFEYLTKTKGLKTVAPEDAKVMVDSGKWVLVDVRPPAAYKQSHPAGAVSVPMYQPLDWSKPDFTKVVKLIAFGANGVTPVEPNPNFVEQLKEATQGGQRGVITLCESGGTLKPSTNFQFGKASRSLQAAYRAFSEGVTDQVCHLDRGVYGWYQADFEFEGEGEYAPDIGRTPMAAAEPTLQVIRQSAGYEMRSTDKK